MTRSSPRAPVAWCLGLAVLAAFTPAEAADEAPGTLAPDVWLGAGLMQDALFVSGDDVCSPASQIRGRHVCLRRSGSQYHGTPLPRGGGRVPLGLSLAATRATLAAMVPIGRTTDTVRAGRAVAGGGPTPDGGDAFIPFLAEAQLAYWLTGRALETRHAGVFVLASAGIAQVDASREVTVLEDPATIPPAQQLDNPLSQSLTAYQRSGAGFAATGMGLFVPFGAASGLLVDLRGVVLFPTAGAALSGAVSGAMGF